MIVSIPSAFKGNIYEERKCTNKQTKEHRMLPGTREISGFSKKEVSLYILFNFRSYIIYPEVSQGVFLI